MDQLVLRNIYHIYMMFARIIVPAGLMWLTSTAQQAIHAVLCIAGNGNDSPMRVDDIAAEIGCPRNYLSKTLHALTRAGVLVSERGPLGGFRLSRTADRLTLGEVVAPFEPIGERRCLLGFASCSDRKPCKAHATWRHLAGDVDEFFRTTTIASLADETAPAATQTSRRPARHHSIRRS
jgi:Rrf2 family iron-sulfur cluster assembly transcriptional regulator